MGYAFALKTRGFTFRIVLIKRFGKQREIRRTDNLVKKEKS